MTSGRAETPPEIKTAALLLSRQPLRPSGVTPWVQRVVEAVSWLKQQNLTLVSSIGIETWELTTSVGSNLGIRTELYLLPSTDWSDEIAQKIFDDYNLARENTRLVPLCNGCSHALDERPLHKRDAAVLSQADLLLPISIRPGGYMSHALAVQKRRSKPIDERFFIGTPEESSKLAYKLTELEPNPTLAQFAGRYLIHWTRAVNGCWPDERPIDFYTSILESSRYPRTAFDTLCHILETHTIRATPRHMPANTPTVSFTALSPTQVLPLMRWRARFTEMSFEPYGIGIRSDLAEKSGIIPVTYHQKAERRAPDTPTWLSQSAGTKSDWRQESEHRHLGDCDLKRFNFDSLVVFCLTRAEAKTIEGKFELKAVPISCD